MTRRFYYDKTPPYSGMINFSWNAGEVYNFIRALSYRPFISPSTYPHTYFRSQQIEVVKAELVQIQKTGDVGKIIQIDDNGIVVQCQDGPICLEKIFYKNMVMAASRYSSEADIRVNDILGR